MISEKACRAWWNADEGWRIVGVEVDPVETEVVPEVKMNGPRRTPLDSIPELSLIGV